MTWTDFDNTLFETNDILTQANIQTYIGDNLMALPHPVALNTADRDVTNTTSELSIWSTTAGGVTIGANKMGTNGYVRMQLFGDWLNNNNAANTITIRAKFGGATVITPISAAIIPVISANRFGFHIDYYVFNRGATNAQTHYCEVRQHFGDDERMLRAEPPMAETAVDTTSAQVIDITAQWSAASANLSYKKKWGQVLLARN